MRKTTHAVAVGWIVAVSLVVGIAPNTIAAPGDIYNLGTLGGYNSMATAVNAAGQVTGISATPASTLGGGHAFLYTGTPGSGGAMADLGPANATYSIANAINDSGQIAGRTNSTTHAFLYTGIPGSGGAMADLGTLGQGSIAYGINSSGQVAGWCVTSLGDRAFLYTGIPGNGGKMFNLGWLGASTQEGDSVGFAINASGQITGRSTYSSNNGLFHAILYTGTPGVNGHMTDLGTLGGTGSEALAINDAGQIVGGSTPTGSIYPHAFLYDGKPGAGGKMYDLGTLGGITSEALGINNEGDVVGKYYPDANQTTIFDALAFLYVGKPGVDGYMIDLNAWLKATNPTEAAKWTLNFAMDISDNGLIVGDGYYYDGPGGLDDGQRAFLLDASGLVPEPSSLAGIGVVILLLGRRRPRILSSLSRVQGLRQNVIGHSELQSLETRTLLSGWTTVDDFRFIGVPGSGPYTPGGMAQALTVDASGNVYSGGYGRDTNSFHSLVKKSSDGGTTWSAPIDDYRARFVQMSDMAVSPAGALFTAGYGGTPSNYSWLVRRSVDGGATWSTVDQYNIGGTRAGAAAIAIDVAGNIYTVGSAQPSGPNGFANLSWVVRRSQDGGSTWSTIDSVAVGQAGGAAGIFVHPTAGIFVAGSMTGGGKKGDVNRWVMRRSTNGGNTWTTVDSYQLDQNYGSAAGSVGMDATGNVYAVGLGGTAAGFGLATSHWIVRKSTNGGATWTTVDNFQLQGYDSRAMRFAKDSLGNLYVTGVSRGHWLVRGNPGGTGTWSIVDDYQLASGGTSSVNAIAANASGDVYTAGLGTAADGTQHWVVRRFTNPGSVSSFAALAAAPPSATFSTSAIASGPSDLFGINGDILL